MIKRIKKLSSPLLVSLTCFLLITGANSCHDPNAKETLITILNTNDIHSQFKSSGELTERNAYGLGGLAKLKTLIDKNKDENTLVFDAGDWSEGGAYFFTDGGSNMLKTLDMLGYNATVVGNHDFFNGVVETANVVQRANPRLKVLGSNKNLSDPMLVNERERIEKLIPDSAEYTTTNGIRVGVIGVLCTDFAYYDYFKPGVVTDPKEKAEKIAIQMHNDGVDVIVLLSHNTFETNVKWAKEIAWVNVVISGHSHVKTPKAVEVANAGQPAYIVETGSWAHFLGKMQLLVAKKKDAITQTRLKNFELLPVVPSLDDDKEVTSFIVEQEKILNTKFKPSLLQKGIKVEDVMKDVIADTSDEMPQYEYKETAIANLAADSYRQALKTDIAFEINSLIGFGLSPGPITLYNIFNVQPHIFGPIPSAGPGKFPEIGSTWRLKKVTLKGSEIRLLLNTFMGVNSSLMPLGWISVSGLKIEYSTKDLNPNVGIIPIRKMKIVRPETGEEFPFEDDKDYTLALHDGLTHAISILEKPLQIDFSRVVPSEIEAWYAIYNFMNELKFIKADSFAPATRYRTLEADLMTEVHLVRAYRTPSDHAQVLEVIIQNNGLQKSSSKAKLHIMRSAPYDYVNLNTENSETIQVFDDREIPVIEAGDKTTIRYVIKPGTFPKTAIYTLGIEILSDDGNMLNNKIVKALRIDAQKK